MYAAFGIAINAFIASLVLELKGISGTPKWPKLHAAALGLFYSLLAMCVPLYLGVILVGNTLRPNFVTIAIYSTVRVSKHHRFSE
jgi:hypothetical protein